MTHTALDPLLFRDAMARFPSGVTIVTTRDLEGQSWGFTASAFSSLSLDPPLLLVCLEKRADCHAAFQNAERFGVSILAAGQHDVALRFAARGTDKFSGLSMRNGALTGALLIPDAAVRMECRTFQRIDGGDHTIILGEVLAAELDSQEPLLHFNRRFGRFVEDH